MRESTKYLAGVIIMFFVFALMPLSVEARMRAWINDSIENYQGESPVAEDEQVKNSSVINYDGDPGLSINAIRFLAYDDDKNWEIGDFELLGAIDEWALENLGDFDLLNVIDYWAVGGYCWDKASGLHKKGNETVCLLLVRSTSFSPVTAANGYGTKYPISWKYRINNQPIRNSVTEYFPELFVNVTFEMDFHFSDLLLSINPNQLSRTAQIEGSITGTASAPGYGSLPIEGNFGVASAESIDISTGKTLINDQDLDVWLAFTIEGYIQGEYIYMEDDDSVSITIDYYTPAEWFLDRSDLDQLDIGYVYDEQSVTGRVCINSGWNCQFFNSAEKWKVVGKEGSITVLGKTYYNVVKVERNTVVPDYTSVGGSQNVTIIYWVARGVGMVKGVGQYTFAGHQLSIELVESSLEQ